MKNRVFLFVVIVLAAALGVLAACTPSAGGPEQGAAESGQTTEGAETVTLYVGPELVECTGVAPQMCMQVKRAPEEDYTLFYDQIDGFTFEPGYEYELLVEITPVENPPADASSLNYRLVEVVSQTEVVVTPELEGPRWVLVELLNSAGETVAAMPEVEVTATFKDGSVGGNAGCNSYSGGYTLDGSNVAIGPLASTMMACFPDQLMQQETDFLNNMQAAATYSIDGNFLKIANADGTVTLTFEAREPISLTSVTWAAINYNNGKEAVVSLIADTSITAQFAEDGTLSGVAGCNNYTTGYTVDGDAMTIEPPASTKKLCPEPEGVMDQELQFLTALSTTATYLIDGTTLTLRTDDGAMVANFMPVDMLP